MYLEHCKFITKNKKLAEQKAIDYTKKYGNKYVVIFKEWLKNYIVTKEEYLPHFKDKGIKTPKGKQKPKQLGFTFL